MFFKSGKVTWNYSQKYRTLIFNNAMQFLLSMVMALMTVIFVRVATQATPVEEIPEDHWCTSRIQVKWLEFITKLELYLLDILNAANKEHLEYILTYRIFYHGYKKIFTNKNFTYFYIVFN